jgi:hypothetical protein
MLNRPEYKKLVAAVRRSLKEQQTSGQPFIAITKGFHSHLIGPQCPRHEFDLAWPRVMKELGLVDDGTHTDTWTLPGKGLMQNLPAWEKDIDERIKDKKLADALKREMKKARHD